MTTASEFERDLRAAVVADTAEFLVLNKPAGLPVQALASQSGLDLTRWLRSTRGSKELYPCHRLDRVTSGLLLIAKGSQVNSQLSQLFQARSVQKYYLALSDRKPAKKQGLVKGDMERSRDGAWKLTRRLQNPAITQFFSFGLGDGLRLFILKPHTGKTHQLRVALKSLGAPIMGDERYGGSQADRCYLHAVDLGFRFQNTDYRFDCEPAQGECFRSDTLRETLTRVGPLSALPWPTL